MKTRIIPAEKKHLRGIAALLSPTGFWRAGIEKNVLNLDYETFAIRYVLEPLLAHTIVCVGHDDTDTVYGFLTCGKKEVLETVPSYAEYYHTCVHQLFSKVSQLEHPEGYVIALLSVDPLYRHQKIGKKLFEYADDMAKKSGCDTISLIVWSFNRDAILFYLNRGMIVSGSISIEAPVSSTLLRMEKSPEITKRINFFETEEYASMQLS